MKNLKMKLYLKQGNSILFSQILIHLITLISVALEEDN